MDILVIIYLENNMNKTEYLNALELELIKAEKGEKYRDACMEYASKLIDSGLPVIFDVKHLSLLLGIKHADLVALLILDKDILYRSKEIPKKTGGYRNILMPCVLLKYIQRWILDNILDNISVSKFATGFSKNSSIVLNARKHLGSECILNLDIKDFFPSISVDDIFRIFYYCGYTKELSYTLSKLCTYDGFMPQGAPSSPAISNIRCLNLDKRISLLCEKYYANYTRYADDITISGKSSIIKMLPIIKEIIEAEGFSVNEKKVRVALPHQRQEVTGILINNGKVAVSRKYKRKFYQEIYYCKKYGPAEHQRYIGDKHSYFKEHLYGKAYYIKMIEPDVGQDLLNKLNEIDWDY